MTHPTNDLASLIERLQARADNAYCDYIAQSRKDECLGWEIKMERGVFGDAELKAHTHRGEFLGRHRALAEVVAELSALEQG